MIHSQKKSRQRPQQSFLGEIARYKLPIPGVTLVYYYETACLYLCMETPTSAQYGHSREENAGVLCYPSETRR